MSDETISLLSKEPSVIYKNKWVLFMIAVFTFIASLCTTVLTAFYSRVITQRNGSIIMAALIIQVHSFAVAITAWLFGILREKYGHKYVLVLGVMLEAVCQILFGLACYIDDLRMFVLCSTILRFVAGIGNSATTSTIFALIDQTFKHRSVTVLGIMEALVGLSNIIGPITGAVVYELTNSSKLPLILPGLLYVSSALPLCMIYKPKEEFKETKHCGLSKKILHARVIYPLLIIFALNGVFGYMCVTLTIYLQSVYPNVVGVAFLFAMFSASFTISSFLTGMATAKNNKFILISCIIGCLGFASCFVVLAMDFNYLLYCIALILLGTFNAAALIGAFGESSYYVSTIDEQDSMNASNRLAGLWTISIHLGKFLLSLIATFVSHTSGSMQYTNLGLSITLYILPLTMVFVYLYKKFI